MSPKDARWQAPTRKWSLSEMLRTLHHADVLDLLSLASWGFSDAVISGRSNRRQHVIWFFTATRQDDQ